MAAGIVAQTRGDSPQCVEHKHASPVRSCGHASQNASSAEYSKGEGSESHFHHRIEVACVVQETTVQAPGREPTSLATATTLLNLRGVKHAGFSIAGDAPLKLFTVHVVDKGKPLYDDSK